MYLRVASNCSGMDDPALKKVSLKHDDVLAALIVHHKKQDNSAAKLDAKVGASFRCKRILID